MSNKLEIRPSRANRPRNAFDLSQRHMFTAPVGALLPVLSLDLIPHDHVEIDAKDFMRTMPMNTSAFMSLRGVYEFFFVPYSQLWHPFDQFIAGTQDFRSNLLSDGAVNSSVVPNVNRADLFTAVLKNTQKDMFGFSCVENAVRLLDLLGYGYPCLKGAAPLSSLKGKLYKHYFSGSVTPFRACAYQKIYQDFYRNKVYEPYQVSSFNFDSPNSVHNDNFVDKFLQLRYRNFALDYLTNLRPTPLVSLPNGLGSALSLSGAKEKFSVTSDKTSAAIGIDSKSSTLSVASIRSAFALDKLLSVSMRAGNTYAEQMEAHFGVRTDEGRDGDVIYIGGFDSNFQTGDVTQTSGTTDPNATSADMASLAGYLGKVVGKSTASGTGRVVYDAKEHGILMCIYSAVPAMQYDSTRLDPFVSKTTRGDYFIPEFENLGMQPLHMSNITDVAVNIKDSADFSAPVSDAALGWQLRYSEYKTAIDINHGQFALDGPLSFWTIGRNRTIGNALLGGSLTLPELKISPSCVDSVFAVDYNGTQVTDQLFGGCYFGVTKVSDMSVDGLPRV